MKRIIPLIALILLLAPTAAFAAPGDARVAVGNDLTAFQKGVVYDHFGIEEGAVPELSVTIDDERATLSGIVPAEKMGSRSISSVYIKELASGEGISVTTHNITWVTAEMYMAALDTAGVDDASVIVAAPTGVSGTAALTGIYKCYEDITGTALSDLAKAAANEELVRTGELADILGSEQALEFMAELKKALAESQNMSDEELRQIIRDTAVELDIELTDAQVEQLLGFTRKLAAMDLSPEELLNQAKRIQKSLEKLQQTQEKANDFFKAVANARNKVVDWFKGIFGIKE
jgi:uncharacterized protein YpuA (DUF1002 family)